MPALRPHAQQLAFAALMLALSFTLAADSHAAYQPHPLPPFLAASITQPSVAYDHITIDTKALGAYYSRNGHEPVWVTGAYLNTRAMQALEILSRAKEHGIYNKDYGLKTIRRLSRFEPQSQEQATQIALLLELLMSNAVYQYARDMQGDSARERWKVNVSQSPVDVVQLFAALGSTRNITPVLSELNPKSKDYINLQHTLQRYSIIAKQGGWPQWQKGEAIKLGAVDARVATLTAILKTTGDLSANYQPIVGSESVYSTALVDAVKRFQERHAIENDGVLGAKTQDALAVPIETRIGQLSATMVRMRAAPQEESQRHILVNIPGYYLHGYDNGKKTIDMRVIVGKPDTRTPLFSNTITDVVFNPTWTPTTNIINASMLPKLRSNPSYFNRGNFTVTRTVNGVSEVVDPTSIDYANAGRDGAKYHFRQGAGSANALGKIKFNIPNSDSIYLHSTAQPELFTKNERALSFGCIRLHDPKALARFVLAPEGWETAKVDSTYDSSASRNVRVNPVPLHLVYWTSWVDEQGRPHFHPDIYGLDKPIVTAMAPVKDGGTVRLALNQ